MNQNQSHEIQDNPFSIPQEKKRDSYLTVHLSPSETDFIYTYETGIEKPRFTSGLYACIGRGNEPV